MNHVLLDNHLYRKEDLANINMIVDTDMSEYMIDIFNFLQKWFDDNDFITVHTSGSTGIPKNISLSKRLMRESAKATLKFFDLKAGDAALLCLSANYIAGKMMIVRAIEGGLRLFTVKPEKIIHIPHSQCFRFSAMVPLQVEETIKALGSKAFDSIENLIIGGSAVPESLEEKLQSLSSCCYATYGMTETASHVALKRLNQKTESSNVYAALSGITFSQDERGCLVINAPLLLKEPLVTNDIIELVSENRFVWKGRFDFVVNSGGLKLFPELIEKKISFLISRPFYLSKRNSETYGEELVLVIEGNPFTCAQEKSLRKQFDSVLSKYEKPKQILYIPTFKYSISGKLLRRVFP